MISRRRRQLLAQLEDASYYQLTQQAGRMADRWTWRGIAASGVGFIATMLALDWWGPLQTSEQNGWLGGPLLAGLVGVVCAVLAALLFFSLGYGLLEQRLRAQLNAQVTARFGWKPRQGAPHPAGRSDTYDRFMIERHVQEGRIGVALVQWHYQVWAHNRTASWDRLGLVGADGRLHRSDDKPHQTPQLDWDGAAVRWFEPYEQEEREQYEQQLRQLLVSRTQLSEQEHLELAAMREALAVRNAEAAAALADQPRAELVA